MKKGLLLLVLLFPIHIMAQSSFSIHGFIKASKPGDKIFLQYRQPQGVVDDSVIVKNGSFSFKGKAQAPVRASLYRNQNPKYANEIFDYATVYLEAGDILVRSRDTLFHSVVSGTPLNNDYAELASALSSFNEKGKGLRDPFTLSAEEMRDTAFVAMTKEKLYAHINEMNPVKFRFVDLHPNSYVSLVTLAALVRDSKLLRKVENSFERLNPMLRALPEGLSIKNAISLGKRISPGMVAKDFLQPDINGKMVKHSDFRGKYILVDFWASWCGPCRAENPNIVSAYNKYKDKA